jgi:hypothetical protein
LNSAVRAPPIWRKPVGDGAKRVTTESVITGAGRAKRESGHARGAVVYSRNRA